MRPIQQMEASDCGPACLAMVLDHFGKSMPLHDVRRTVGSTSRDGATAFDLQQAAERLGLHCRAVWLRDTHDLQYVQPAAILHVLRREDAERLHFVVLRKVTSRWIHIADPDGGPRKLRPDEFSRIFAGTVLEFTPADSFVSAKRRPSGLGRYLRAIVRDARVLRRVLITSLFIQVFGLALPLLTSLVIDRVVPRGDGDLLTVLGMGLAAIVGMNLLTTFLRAHLLLHLRTRLDAQLTIDFVQHLMRLPFSFFFTRSIGDLVMRLGSNATVREMLTSSVLAAFLDGTMVLLYFTLLFAISPPIGWLVVALAVMQIGLLLAFYRPFQELITVELARQARSQGYAVEMLNGIETLKSAGAESQSVERWTNHYIDVLNTSVDRGRLNARFQALLGAVQMGSPLVVLWVGAWLVVQQQAGMTLGTLFAVSAIAAGLLLPLSNVVNSTLQLNAVRSYLERIQDVLEAQPEQDPADVRPAPQLKGAITLVDVSFRYGPPHQAWALRGINLDIAPGEHVAVVGRSGSGKSTLARLLAGLHRPTTGQITFDNHDLAHFELSSLRRQLGLVPQVPYLFEDTVRNNITLADPRVPENAVVRAARLAQIHADIEALPATYDSLISEGGASLSGGQRQRIALARALVHAPPVLILDEATSDLDTVSESAIQQALDELPCTVIIIAHRLSTIARSNRIVVLRNGELHEQGPPSELLATGGEFAALVAAQTPPGQPALRMS